MRPRLPYGVVATLLACSSLLHAQELPEPTDAVEPPTVDATPEPLDGVPVVDLVIDWPTPGTTVQLPFTIEGSAPPAATLELWIDDAIERAFRADSDGNFLVPVTRQAEHSVTIHHVVDGEHLQSVAVDVVWSAQPVATQQLPKIQTTVIPPPPDLAERPADLPLQPTTTSTVITSSPRRPVSRGVRVLAEAGVGLGAALTGGIVGGLGGIAVGLATSQEGLAALGAGGIGSAIGAMIGLPIGVTLIGNSLGGNGKVGFVVLGELLGVGASIGLAALDYTGTAGTVAVLTLPLTGAILGYELSSDANSPKVKRGISVSPAVGSSWDGKATTLGLRLTF